MKIVWLVSDDKLNEVKDRLFKDELVNRQSITIRSARSLDFNKDGNYIYINGSGESIEKAKELSGATITVKPIVTLADDEYVFVLGRATGRRGEKVLDIEHCYLYRFSNGKLVEGRTMPVDLYEFDEFWK